MLRETGPEGGKEINTESHAPEEKRRRAKEPNGESEGRVGWRGGGGRVEERRAESEPRRNTVGRAEGEKE